MNKWTLQALNMDLMISEKNFGILEKISEFLFFIFSGPSNHVGGLIWSLSNSAKAQGPSWTFIDPQMDPGKLISGEP